MNYNNNGFLMKHILSKCISIKHNPLEEFFSPKERINAIKITTFHVNCTVVCWFIHYPELFQTIKKYYKSISLILTNHPDFYIHLLGCLLILLTIFTHRTFAHTKKQQFMTADMYMLIYPKMPSSSSRRRSSPGVLVNFLLMISLNVSSNFKIIQKLSQFYCVWKIDIETEQPWFYSPAITMYLVKLTYDQSL